MSKTVSLYLSAVKNDILPAFHRAYSPFRASWLIDCSSEKETLVNGMERSFRSKTDPIFLSAAILEDALDKYIRSDGQHGSKVQTITSAAISLMNFVEYEVGSKYELYGTDPLTTAKTYHAMVCDSINGNGIWKTSNKNRQNYQMNKKKIENYENPGKQKKLLLSYKSYLVSKGREEALAEVLRYDAEDAPVPTPSMFVQLTNTVMCEIIMSTGVRPVVVLDMPNGPYEDAVPGESLEKDDRSQFSI